MLAELNVAVSIETVPTCRIDGASASAAACSRREAREDQDVRRGNQKTGYDDALHSLGSIPNERRVLPNGVSDHKRLLAALASLDESFGRPGCGRHASGAGLPERGAPIRQDCTTLTLASGDVEQRPAEDFFEPLERPFRTPATSSSASVAGRVRMSDSDWSMLPRGNVRSGEAPNPPQCPIRSCARPVKFSVVKSPAVTERT
jgi:hypothetical protein